MAYAILTNDFDSDIWCGKAYCCYHCPEQGTCSEISGCARDTIFKTYKKHYPEECDCYPLTWGEAQRIFCFMKMFHDLDKLTVLGRYAKFHEKVKELVRKKKLDQEKKK